ncbi:MAG: hypothetical protein ACRD1R_02940, partial [Acidobacteriota bacterium]
MGKVLKTVDRDRPFMFPPSVQEWLPENHLARFVVEVVSKLDLRPLFVQILVLAQAIGLLKLGRVSLDGTKVKANA